MTRSLEDDQVFRWGLLGKNNKTPVRHPVEESWPLIVHRIIKPGYGGDTDVYGLIAPWWPSLEKLQWHFDFGWLFDAFPMAFGCVPQCLLNVFLISSQWL